MNRHRPTTMQLYLAHCPRAVDHYERGTPQHREIFAVGTAAHEVLFTIGQGGSVDAVVSELIATGRLGEDSEGPMRPDAVFEGRDLALAWTAAHPIPDGAFFEHAFAFDRDWRPCAWEDARFGTRVDVVHRRSDEDEDGHDVQDLVITDYKSAWPATETELDTLQRRAQAVSGWVSWGDEIGSITIAVANLRRRQVFERTIVLDEEGVALLHRWQHDLEIVMDAIEVRGPDGQRPARPGARCGGCPYAASCEPAQQILRDQGVLDAADLVRRYAAAKTTAAELERRIRAATSDGVLVVDDVEVGPLAATERTPRPGLMLDEQAAWLTSSGVAVDEALTSALKGWWDGLGTPPVGMVEKLGKLLHRKPADRRPWLEQAVVVTRAPRFGLRRLAAPDQPTEPAADGAPGGEE